MDIDGMTYAQKSKYYAEKAAECIEIGASEQGVQRAQVYAMLAQTWAIREHTFQTTDV